MSCIKQLAEQKKQAHGVFYMDKGTVLESCGEYKGYDYCVTFNMHGYRCAYIALPNNHYYADKDKAEEELEVSGGVTFHDKQHLVESGCNDIWVGFDSGCQDLESARSLFMDNPYLNWLDNNPQAAPISSFKPTKTLNGMIKECEFLIDQIAKK